MKGRLVLPIILIFLSSNIELNAFQKLSQDVEFSHDSGIYKFLAKNWKAGRRQPFDVKHINTAVVLLEINSEGDIIDEIITENSNAQGFSKGLRETVRMTKGYWKVRIQSTDTFFVIIPMIQKKRAYDIEKQYSKDYEQLYKKKFEELENLNIQDYELCENKLCILLNPIRNVYSDPIR